MKATAIAFVAVALALASVLTVASPWQGGEARGLASEADGGQGMAARRSRSLASSKPGNVRCNRNPFACRFPGSTGPDCCHRRCVDMGSDVNNCGECGNVCEFGKDCCKGKCVDTNSHRHHCGRCFNKCKKGIKCEGGMCGYA